MSLTERVVFLPFLFIGPFSYETQNRGAVATDVRHSTVVATQMRSAAGPDRCRRSVLCLRDFADNKRTHLLFTSLVPSDEQQTTNRDQTSAPNRRKSPMSH